MATPAYVICFLLHFFLFIKCCVIEYVAISHTSWFTDTFFTCKCCLNMDTFYNFDTSWVGSLRPLLILCMNTMHSNIGREGHSNIGVRSISKQTSKNP